MNYEKQSDAFDSSQGPERDFKGTPEELQIMIEKTFSQGFETPKLDVSKGFSTF